MSDDPATTTPSSISDDNTDATATTATATDTAVADDSSYSTKPSRPHITWCDSYTKAQSAVDSLSSILPHVPPSLSSSETPATSLLHDPEIAKEFSRLLRQPDSGLGDNNLCRWLYDTFQTGQPALHLVVLRFLPILAGVYLSRASLHKPLAGFEAVLLALYAHETTVRNGQAITVSIPDLSHSSIYHETTKTPKNTATELNIAVLSPTLEPHGTVRSTRRARIVGVALELYYTKISQLPVDSKIEFCEFCRIWAGEDGDVYKDGENGEMGLPGLGESEGEIEEKKEKGKEGRINLPWELLQPMLRILGHCLMGPDKSKELHEAACCACRSLYARSLHDINPKAILATGSLLRLVNMTSDLDNFDHTDIPQTNLIAL
ncbi:hyccin [Coffea eugenioides]|uniref:Hyccin-like n=1 Tax=Coffea arabica TaxID=13443 RepID=A0ABM4WST7_COFAR|nr:hyccin [Coffea arabica]XP_027155697.1 hyccin [Coffea eugenioides]